MHALTISLKRHNKYEVQLKRVQGKFWREESEGNDITIKLSSQNF